MRSLMAAAFAALACVNTAEAQTPTRTITTSMPGYHYFNRPGATIEQHNAELAACTSALLGVNPPAGGSGAIMAVIDAVVVTRRGRAANYENCMVTRGWRVAQLEEEVGRELEQLDRPALLERLAPLVGSEDAGIGRVFDNDVTRPEVIIFGQPEGLDEVSLSVRSMPERVDVTNELGAPSLALCEMLLFPNAREVVRPTQLRQIERAPADRGVVVVHVGGPMTSSGSLAGPTVVFERVSGSPGTDGQPFFFMANAPRRLVAPAGQRMTEGPTAFAVPPGRWRMTAMIENQYIVSFCMGAPSFEVAAGEAVYAGAYYTGLNPRGPDMSLDRLQTELARLPELAARLRPAAYRNGETYQCAGAAYLYAYEVPDAPFVEGYRFGSRANASAAAATP